MDVERTFLIYASSSLLSSPELSYAKVYEPYIRALLGAGSHFCGKHESLRRQLLRTLVFTAKLWGETTPRDRSMREILGTNPM